MFFEDYVGMSPNEAVKNGGWIKELNGPRTLQNKISKYPEIKIGDTVRHLLTKGEHEGDKTKQRATDPNWSLDLFVVEKIKDLIKSAYYYLDNKKHYL